MKVSRRGSVWRVRGSRVDARAWLSAAYAMTGTAYVALERAGRSPVVALWPKRAGAGDLGARFLREYEDFSRRWAQARRPQAAAPLQVQALSRPEAVLNPAKKQLIEALLAEGGQDDPEGIAATWDSLRRRS